MSTMKAVGEKVTELTRLGAGFIAPAASTLVGKAERLPLDEMSRRLDIALRALRGGDASTPGAVATTKMPLLQVAEELVVLAEGLVVHLAQEMVNSYQFDKRTGVSKFTVPAGVTDVDAMKALNQYIRKNHSDLERDAVNSSDLNWYETLPKKYPEHCQERDYSRSRRITITVVVDGTKNELPASQLRVLKRKSLVLSDPRDQALAAAIHACKHNGADLFSPYYVRGSVPGVAMITGRGDRGVCRTSLGDYDYQATAASGSPSPKLK